MTRQQSKSTEQPPTPAVKGSYQCSLATIQVSSKPRMVSPTEDTQASIYKRPFKKRLRQIIKVAESFPLLEGDDSCDDNEGSVHGSRDCKNQPRNESNTPPVLEHQVAAVYPVTELHQLCLEESTTRSLPPSFTTPTSVSASLLSSTLTGNVIPWETEGITLKGDYIAPLPTWTPNLYPSKTRMPELPGSNIARYMNSATCNTVDRSNRKQLSPTKRQCRSKAHDATHATALAEPPNKSPVLKLAKGLAESSRASYDRVVVKQDSIVDCSSRNDHVPLPIPSPVPKQSACRQQHCTHIDWQDCKQAPYQHPQFLRKKSSRRQTTVQDKNVDILVIPSREEDTQQPLPSLKKPPPPSPAALSVNAGPSRSLYNEGSMYNEAGAFRPNSATMTRMSLLPGSYWENTGETQNQHPSPVLSTQSLPQRRLDHLVFGKRTASTPVLHSGLDVKKPAQGDIYFVPGDSTREAYQECNRKPAPLQNSNYSNSTCQVQGGYMS